MKMFAFTTAEIMPTWTRLYFWNENTSQFRESSSPICIFNLSQIESEESILNNSMSIYPLAYKYVKVLKFGLLRKG